MQQTPLIHSTRPRRRLVIAALGTLAALAGVVWVLAGHAGATPRFSRTADGVLSLTYTLGNRAMTAPGFHADNPASGQPVDREAPLELTAAVYAPASLTGPPHPLIVLAHGYWPTCADRTAGRVYTRTLAALQTAHSPQVTRRLSREFDAAEAKLMRWPCAAGTPPLPSYRGFAYLGDALARRGFIVLSVSLNGVNAGELAGDDGARAAVIDRHLQMWSELDRTGAGPLAGRFIDATTGRHVHPDFTGRIDLSDVGLLGHSRGGRAVMYTAAHPAQLPAGVHIRAVFGLAAAGYGTSPSAYRVSGAALMTWSGTCDQSVGTQDLAYNQIAAAGTPPTANLNVTVNGANHDFLNTQWSPSSHQVLAHDDAVVVPHHPGQCEGLSTTGGSGPTFRELTEAQERTVARTYVTAFFARYLQGDTAEDSILTGAQLPDARITTVRITQFRSRRSDGVSAQGG